MAKTTICITIETELIEKFKQKEGKGNVSKAITQFIEHSLNLQNTVISPQDKELFNMEYEKTKKTYNDITIKLKQLENKKEEYDQEIEKQKEIELLNKKELEDKAIKCIKCNNNTFDHNRVKLKDGFMCRGCFSTMTVEDFKKYT